MKTLEKTPKSSKPTALSLDAPTYKIVCKLAKADGLSVEAWIEKTAKEFAEQRQNRAKIPIMFPASSVRLLDEILKASGTLLSVEEYAEEFLQREILDSLDQGGAGVPEILAGGYQLEPGDMEAMRAVVDRWKALDAASA